MFLEWAVATTPGRVKERSQADERDTAPAVKILPQAQKD